jgi:hypothetical protein
MSESEDERKRVVAPAGALGPSSIGAQLLQILGVILIAYLVLHFILNTGDA